MLEILTKSLTEEGVFDGELPAVLKTMVDAIPNNTIPYRMKLSIAVSEMILYASHLRRNILHYNGSLIPINAITFSIASSGAGKDSSVNAVRKCFADGYQLIDKKRKEIATRNAIAAATAAGKNTPEEWEVYKEFWVKPEELFTSPDSTIKGLMKHFNALEDAGVGGGFVYSGEIGAELSAGGIVDLMKFMSEVYDEGKKELKLIGDKSEQLKPLINLPVSALFVGSQENLLYDDTVKKKFKTEFSTKLARRSFFNFNPEIVPLPTYSSAEELRAAKRAGDDTALRAREEVNKIVEQITKQNLAGVGQALTIDEDTRDLFYDYERYNTEVADTISPLYPISKIVRTHLQWKALKLSGAIALFNGHHSITKSDYISAISYCEMLDKDMMLFEQELVKEPYELFVDYMRYRAENGKASISMHSLRKMGYIPTSGSPDSKIKELIALASSFDKNGIYTYTNNEVQFEEIVQTDIIGASFLPQTGDKDQRKVTCESGYSYVTTTFPELHALLSGDFAYCPFEFQDGVRGKDNIISGTKWVVLDVDESNITDEECHFILQNINHHIARTSDPDNAFKFRVLLELDSIVTLDPVVWKAFVKSIGDSLSIKIDNVPQSQIFFGFAGRNVLSVTNQEPIAVKDHLLIAYAQETKAVDISKLTAKQKEELLDQRHQTFAYAFEAANGNGSRSLVRAMYHARDLGMSKEEIIDLLHEINNFWDYPMDQTRLDTTILSQVRRLKEA